MKKYATLEEYERLADYMLEKKPYLDEEMTFRRLCDVLGLPYEELNNTLMAELGLGGQEIMERFRKGEEKDIVFKEGFS